MKKKNQEVSLPKILDTQAPFAIREAFNQLRTNLMYTIADTSTGAPVFAVTSSIEGTGKSTIITNLALSFTQLGQKVLLIDADMRCPVINEYFGYDDKHPGLSELISGIAKDVITPNVRENLDLITSGRIPPNPSELLTSPRFSAFLGEWKQKYDIIFIDFPPIGIVTDSMASFKSITGYIFTVRAGKSTAKKINSAIESMEHLGAKIVGVVLNDYDIKGYYYYHHGYKYSRRGRYASESEKYASRADAAASSAKNASK